MSSNTVRTIQRNEISLVGGEQASYERIQDLQWLFENLYARQPIEIRINPNEFAELVKKVDRVMFGEQGATKLFGMDIRVKDSLKDGEWMLTYFEEKHYDEKVIL